MSVAGNKNGNRRTANIRSVGYSDLFVLSKEDLWEALQEYPEARRTLIEKGRQMLRKDNLLDEETAKAQDTIRTSEEKAELVQHSLEKAKTGVARLMAEMRSVTYKLRHRLQQLEKLAAQRDSAAAETSSPYPDDAVTDDWRRLPRYTRCFAGVHISIDTNFIIQRIALYTIWKIVLWFYFFVFTMIYFHFFKSPTLHNNDD